MTESMGERLLAEQVRQLRLPAPLRERKGKGWAKGKQMGAANPVWKSDAAGYKGLHQRVGVAFGRPKVCSRCQTTDSSKTYEWANLTGQYADLSDYARMCRSCHRLYDRDRRPPSVAKVARTCEVCGARFTAWAAWVRRGGGRYCSVACKGVAQRGPR